MIKRLILKGKHPFILQLKSSIKSIEIEETMDLLFHRPLGLLFSKIAIKVGLSPITISLLSLLTGLVSGILFYWQNNIVLSLIGVFLLTLSAIFDSSDGQVARLTKSSSHVGMIIDGLIDTLVFVFIYFFASIHFYPKYGFWIIFLALVSGFANSIHSLIYDFYKNEVSFLLCDIEGLRNITISEARRNFKNQTNLVFKILDYFHLNYLKKQYSFTIRKDENKIKFQNLKNDPKTKDHFLAYYRKNILPLMPFWAIFGGTNVHRTLIMFFCLMGSFHYYLIFNLFFLSVPIIILMKIQNKKDLELLDHFINFPNARAELKK